MCLVKLRFLILKSIGVLEFYLIASSYWGHKHRVYYRVMSALEPHVFVLMTLGGAPKETC